MLKRFDFSRGVFAACLTPFWRDGSIDWPSLRAYIAEVVAGRPAGVVVNTRIGEASSISLDEATEIVGRAKKIAGDQCAVVSGIEPHWGDGPAAIERLVRAGVDGFLVPAATEAGGGRTSCARLVSAFDVLLRAKPYAGAVDTEFTTSESTFLEERVQGRRGIAVGFAALPTAQVVEFDRLVETRDVVKARQIMARLAPWVSFCAAGGHDQFVVRAKLVLYRQGVIACAKTRNPSEDPPAKFISDLDEFFTRHRLDEPINLPPGYILARQRLPA